jgi:cell migration-inducing and hyaluronan-binding protein
LQAPAFKDTTEIQVETLLDWVAGDRIALAPTSYKYEAGEDVIISSYDRETGIATLETPLVWYHWGQSTSTANDFNGLDMRGEVVLLSRNIVVAGEDVESWGGRVITGDSMEFSNGEIVFKYGQTLMDNVEIYNCSQQDSYDAAIGWNSAITLESSVTNSAIHNGLGWAVHIEQSKNVVFDNNVMFNFRPFGLVVEAS